MGLHFHDWIDDNNGITDIFKRVTRMRFVHFWDLGVQKIFVLKKMFEFLLG